MTRITHLADLQKNTLEVKVRLLDPDPLLKPDSLARVRFLGPAGSPGASDADPGDAPAGVLVPAAALDGSGGGSAVWVVHGRRGLTGRAERVPVEPLPRAPASADRVPRTPGLAAVRGALALGDLAIVDPAGVALAPGDRVRFRSADAASPLARSADP